MGILTIKMPVDSVQDWVSCLHLNSASNTQTVVGDNDPVGKESSTIPGGEAGEDSGEIMSNKPNTNKLNLGPEICVIHLPQEAPVIHSFIYLYTGNHQFKKYILNKSKVLKSKSLK